jgi:hypothetical protein
MTRFFIVLSLFITTKTYCQTEQFITPIDGEYMHDFFIVNYVDWSFTGYHDYLCGSKSYNGHQGTDFVLRNFSQMDSGVFVFAAEDGIVTYTIDTLFDRNKTAVSGGLGNYICIKHDNLFYTYYGHLKKCSVLVNVGDSVHAGDTLAMVGSSGYSSDPHLHFEVWYDSLYNWDPFSGTCGNPQTLWIDALPYHADFGIIDHDCNNSIPTLDTLKERLPSQKIYSYPADTVINFWMQGYGVLANDISAVNWIAPDGDIYYTYDYAHTVDWWYYYFWSYIPLNAFTQTGIWKIQYLVNDEVKIEDSVEVVSHPSDIGSIDQYYFITNPGNGDILLHWNIPLTKSSPVFWYDLFGRLLYSDTIEASSTEYLISGNWKPQSIYFIIIGNNKPFTCIMP